MKAWRNIKGNNGKRPTQRVKIQGSTWLLDGLLIRAGISNPFNWQATDLGPRYLRDLLETGNRGWWSKFTTLAKRLFS